MSQAKILTKDQLTQVLDFVSTSSTNPVRDYVVVLLSFKSGLRAQEIAGLTWRNVTSPTGAIVTDVIEIPAAIAKKGHRRVVPIHPAVRAALIAWRQFALNTGDNDAVVPGSYRGHISPNALQRYLSRLYTKAGLRGVTSHSGRRTFITKAARIANTHGCSLKDVQVLAGHKHVDTTEKYIDLSMNTYALVNAL